MPVKIAAGNASVGISQIQLQEGQRVILDRISWQEFEDILADLGEHRQISPSIPVADGISLFLERSDDLPMSALCREFRVWCCNQDPKD